MVTYDEETVTYDEETVNRDAEPPDGDYYVTLRTASTFCVDHDGVDARPPRTAFLLGPYEDLREAIADKNRARDLACQIDTFAWFYYYGTARAPHGVRIHTVFDRERRDG